MLTEGQASTIKGRIAQIRGECVSHLLETSNVLLKQINPLGPSKVSEILEALISETSKLISKMRDRISSEIPSMVSSMKGTLVEIERDQVLSLCREALDETPYLKRYAILKDSIEHKLRSHGLDSSLEILNSELIYSRYELTVVNGLSNIQSHLKNRLDVLVHSDRRESPLEYNGSHSILEESNRLLELKPNIAGIGLNLNRLVEIFSAWWRRRKK